MPFAWQGERGSSKHDAVVRAARARACDALRHACKEQALSSTDPAAAAAAATTATAAAAATATDQEAAAATGGGGESGPRPAGAAGAAGDDGGPGVDGVIGRLFPLVLSLAGITVEGARCLCALFAGQGGVGEAARAAVLMPPGGSGGGDAAAAAAAAGGTGIRAEIRAVVCLLVRIERMEGLL